MTQIKNTVEPFGEVNVRANGGRVDVTATILMQQKNLGDIVVLGYRRPHHLCRSQEIQSEVHLVGTPVQGNTVPEILWSSVVLSNGEVGPDGLINPLLGLLHTAMEA